MNLKALLRHAEGSRRLREVHEQNMLETIAEINRRFDAGESTGDWQTDFLLQNFGIPSVPINNRFARVITEAYELFHSAAPGEFVMTLSEKRYGAYEQKKEVTLLIETGLLAGPAKFDRYEITLPVRSHKKAHTKGFNRENITPIMLSKLWPFQPGEGQILISGEEIGAAGTNNEPTSRYRFFFQYGAPARQLFKDVTGQDTDFL